MTNASPLASPQKHTPSFSGFLKNRDLKLRRNKVTTLQVNLGKLCNQACRHCHVEAGPTKTKENMGLSTFQRLSELILTSNNLQTIDITGGAPELNPHFRDLVKLARDRNIEVIDRCNLTVLFEKGQEDTAQFLADNKVQIVASLPCYSRDNVDKQRGNGVFDKSIQALKQLNQLGYGQDSSDLKLHLVYNPLGPSLPPEQHKLEERYKKELFEDFGISFNNLFTITNMPIKRFLNDLQRTGRLQEYMDLLASSFNSSALDGVMCRDLISISWDGKLYDCDFNQMLELELENTHLKTIWDLKSFEDLNNSAIKVDNHCFGCTAGQGSSCTGATL